MFSIITYENIKVISPYNLKTLEQLVITKEINEHNKVYFTGIIPDDAKEQYLLRSNIDDKIEVSIENGTVIFKGIVTDISIKAVRGVYHIEVQGVSSTFDLDLQIKRRSFQNADMTYNELIEYILKDYKGSDFIDVVTGSIGSVIVQYNETDWEFLKRMASRLNTGLVAEVKSEKPKFYFGIPEGKEFGGQYNYNIGKVFNKKAFMYYEVETDDIPEIGDKIKYMNQELTVYKVVTGLKKGILKSQCLLVTDEGLNQALIKNKKIEGASIEGKIIDIWEDKVRVHLDIDKEQKKEEAYWFPYSTFYTTEGQTGWYCTPELEDRVKVYFPGNEEEKGLVINSIRRKISSGDKINDPDVKYFRTKHGKEKKFTKKELSISARDNKLLIKLNEDDGIDILSDESIKINSEVDLVIKADNIAFEAGEEIVAECEESSIVMNGLTHFYSKYVKARC